MTPKLPYGGPAALLFLLLCFPLVCRSFLFADQAGLLDWTRENVGIARYVVQQGRFAVLATESGVLTRIKSRTGVIQWRRVLPQGENIDALCAHKKTVFIYSKSTGKASMWQSLDGTLIWDQVVRTNGEKQGDHAAALSHVNLDVNEDGIQDVVLLSHNTLTLLSGADGEILWSSAIEGGDFARLAIDNADGHVYALGYGVGGELIIHIAKLEDGVSESKATHGGIRDYMVHTPVDTEDNDGPILSYLSGTGQLHNLNLRSAENTSSKMMDGNFFVDVNQESSERTTPIMVVKRDDEHLEVLDSKTMATIKTVDGGAHEPVFGVMRGKKSSYFVVAAVSSTKTTVKVHSMLGEVSSELSFDSAGLTTNFDGKAYRVFPSLIENPKTGAVKARALLITHAHSVATLQKGSDLWITDQSLARVTSAVVVERETALQGELGADSEALAPSFMTRLKMQVEEIMGLGFKSLEAFNTLVDFATSKGGGDTTQVQLSDSNSIFFGFYKVVVAATASGKVVGLDSMTGDTIWSNYHAPSVPDEVRDIKVFVTRAQKAEGKLAQVVVSIVSSETGYVSLFWLDASSGTLLKTETVARRTKQIFVVNGVAGEEFSDAVLCIVDDQDKVLVFSKDADSSLLLREGFKSLYFSQIDSDGKGLSGYGVTNNGELMQYPKWTVRFPSTSTEVAAIASGSLLRGVNSPVHTLGDDSLMVKYLNPHLMSVALIGEETTAKTGSVTSMVTVLLIDAVSGRLIQRFVHKDAGGPVRLTQSENWIFYSFWNKKARRTEIASVALYDGAIGAYALNPWSPLPKIIQNDQKELETNFSSFGAEAPLILQKSFIFPSGIAALSGINTRDGVTEKQLLIGTLKGQICQLDRRFLDPRRPVAKAGAKPSEADQREGLMPYSPMLPLPPTSILSYSKQIERLSKIICVPAGLESTTLVLGVGLDVFYTRAMPSQGFDILPEDFQWELLVIIISALFIGQYVAKSSYAQKLLNDRWK
jgi:ER membrane protein complex subunit 1